MIKTLRNLLKQDKERFVVPRGVQDVIPINRFSRFVRFLPSLTNWEIFLI